LLETYLDELVVVVESHIYSVSLVVGLVEWREDLNFCGRILLHVTISMNHKRRHSFFNSSRRFMEILSWLVPFLRKTP
jgi:hypothetical protein